MRENICTLAQHIHEVPKVQAVPKPFMKQCLDILHNWDKCFTSQFPSKMKWNHCFYTHSISSFKNKQVSPKTVLLEGMMIRRKSR